MNEERIDSLLGGFVIVLIGVVISLSAVWGIVDNVYSMSGGAAPILFIILGIGSIIIGASILANKS